MKNITDKDTEKKAQFLNASIGPKYYNELAALLGPDKPLKTLKYADLEKSYKNMLTPKKNVVVSQHFFFNTYQTENQTISEFVATLQK